MQPLPIVEHLDELKDIALRLSSGLVATMVDQLCFKDHKEALHGRIIVHVARAAHTGQGLRIGQELLVVAAGILAAAVRMMQKAGSWETRKFRGQNRPEFLSKKSPW